MTTFIKRLKTLLCLNHQQVTIRLFLTIWFEIRINLKYRYSIVQTKIIMRLILKWLKSKVWKSFIVRHPSPVDDSMQLREKLVAYYADQANEKERVTWLRAIIKADANAGDTRSDYSRTVAANATIDLARPKLASYNAIKLTAPLKASLARKQKYMEQALQAYAAAADYGIAEVTMEATFYIAEIYNQLGRDLMGSERPAELTAEELEQYDILLEEQAYPFEEQALDLHEVNAARTAQGIYDEWVRRSLEALEELLPVRYAKHEEGEQFVTTIL